MPFYFNPSEKSQQFPEDLAWIQRNLELWQHGKMNFETPPPVLDREGFKTPQDLFFVRQHTEVPRLVPAGANPDEHEFFIEQIIHDATGQPQKQKKVEHYPWLFEGKL